MYEYGRLNMPRNPILQGCPIPLQVGERLTITDTRELQTVPSPVFETRRLRSFRELIEDRLLVAQKYIQPKIQMGFLL